MHLCLISGIGAPCDVTNINTQDFFCFYSTYLDIWFYSLGFAVYVSSLSSLFVKFKLHFWCCWFSPKSCMFFATRLTVSVMLKMAQAHCYSVILLHGSAWFHILLHVKVHRVSRRKGHEKEPCRALWNSCRVNASHACQKGPESSLVLWFKVIP